MENISERDEHLFREKSIIKDLLLSRIDNEYLELTNEAENLLTNAAQISAKFNYNKCKKRN